MDINKEIIYEEIVQAILARLDLDQVLKAILEKGMKFFKSDAASIMLFDEKGEFLEIAAFIGLDSEYVKIVKVRRGEEIAGRVIEENRARIIPDILEIFKNSGDMYSYEKIDKEGLRSMICAPIISEQEPLGCINIYYRKKYTFDQTEVNAISLFCNLSAIALENAKFHKETEKKLQDIVELSEICLSINSLVSIDEIIHSILNIATNLVNARGGGLVLIKPNEIDIDRAYYLDKSTPDLKPYKGEAHLMSELIRQIIGSKKNLCIPDTSVSKLINPEKLNNKEWRAVLGIPLKIKEKITGVLLVNDSQPRDFSEREVSLVNFLVNEAAVAIENARLYENIERRMRELSILYEVGQGLISSLELDTLFDATLQRLKDSMNFVNCAILFVDEGNNELYFRSSIGYSEEVTRMRLKMGEGLTGYAAQTGKLVYVPDVNKDSRYIKGMGETQSEVTVPLEVGRKVIGVLDVESPMINAFGEWEINMLKSVAAQLSVVIENSMLYEETRALSLTDPLTEVANRRHFNIILDAELKRSERYGRPLSLIIIDLDHFKEYNDRYGHPAGDVVLKEFTKTMIAEIRDIDFMARYGGDEFIIILPETDVLFAKLVGERIRQKIEINPIDPSITISLGIASFPKDSRDRESLIESADRALYIAKQLGGNRIALVD